MTEPTTPPALPATMHAIGAFRGLPVTDADSLVDVELPLPEVRPRDVLVRVEAVSVNPVDVKRRAATRPSESPTVFGFDASGTVVAVGSEANLFAVGDEVFYAGSVIRQGTDADYHAVDERIVGRKPTTLNWAEAAALPLTAITAWESLFDRLRLTRESTGTLLVLGAAGGVGSIMTQLAKHLTGVTVIATASRPETQEWAVRMGADHVVDHTGDLARQVFEHAPGGVDYLFTPQSAGRIPLFAEVLAPFGQIVAIDEAPDLDLRPLKPKSIAWHWELMFTRSTFGTPDLIEQHLLLDAVADLVDDGRIASTLTTTITGFNAEKLREAHAIVESGRAIGKVVVTR